MDKSTKIFPIFCPSLILNTPIPVKGTAFIARRYLVSRRKVSLVSMLTLISVAGITLGTALLIVVLSVFNGFYDLVKDLLLAQDPDIRIESATAPVMAYPDSLQRRLAGISDIRSISPYVTGQCLLIEPGQEAAEEKIVTVQGIYPDLFFPLRNHPESITSGVFDVGFRDGVAGMIVPRRLFDQLSLSLHQKVVLMSAVGMEKTLTMFAMPRGYRFEVRGVYHLRELEHEPVVYVSMRAAQYLFETGTRLSGIDLELRRHEDAFRLKATLQHDLGPTYRIQTWYDLQKPLYDVMNMEKWAGFAILLIIIMVAVLNIVGSLTMLVIQKQRDIGALMSFGYSRKAIRSIFLRQGWYIGWLGCLLGGGLGLGLAWAQKVYGLVKLSGSGSFIIEYYPVHVAWSDVTLVLAGTLLISLMASWYPAIRASHIHPADAVRYE